MSLEELQIAFDWAAKEGWNPGIHDAQAFYETDPNGFFIGYLGDQPVATFSAIKYDKDFAFLGFYIVHPNYRGKGYGKQIWDFGMRHINTVKTVGLDGVEEQVDNYVESGFTLAYKTVTYLGKSQNYSYDNLNLKDIAPADLTDLVSYDTKHFPTPRRKFLQNWIKLPNTRGFIHLDKKKISGCGSIRPSVNGYKIGPLFAENHDIAETILKALLSSIESNKDVQIDVPEANTISERLLEKHGFTKQFSLSRMYKGPVPDLPFQNIFANTTYELG